MPPEERNTSVNNSINGDNEEVIKLLIDSTYAQQRGHLHDFLSIVPKVIGGKVKQDQICNILALYVSL